jgi:pyruvate dehydrogenase E2 component (dihydrolipoamide acetyltransferase)
MRFEMKMPDLSTNDSDVRIVRWLIEAGQKVDRGGPLLEVETDKATMEVESPVSGVLQDVRSPANDAVPVGHVIAVLEVEGATPTVPTFPVSPAESVPLLRRSSAEPSSPSGTACEQAVAHGQQTPAQSGAKGMFARNRAAAASSTAPRPSANAIPLTLAQRVAGKRLQESKQTIPHFYLQTSVNATAMIARRKSAEPVKLAWDAFFVQAVAKAIARSERFRSRFDGERLLPADTDAIGVAVDVEDDLYVIPIASPAVKTVEQISEEIRRGVRQIRDNDAEARKIRPALMTITNLGVANVERFIPVINPPEPAILGIGRVAPTAVAREDGSVRVEQRCVLTLCVDHRVCSGRYAAGFLEAIVKELESV